MTLRAAILSTGDELTTGRIADTNASWIADKLFELGIDVVAILAVGDYPDRLAWAWRKAMALADVVISTGGIGPTADDLTTETVAEVLGVPLELDQPSVDRIRGFFASRGIDMPENNVKQARFPAGATIVPNNFGTAPGYRATQGDKHLVVLPGVPREMKPMMEETVLPWLATSRARTRRSCARSRPSASASPASTSSWPVPSTRPRRGSRFAPASPRSPCASSCAGPMPRHVSSASPAACASGSARGSSARAPSRWSRWWATRSARRG
jgi:nicotinamide-nucleotide amidase